MQAQRAPLPGRRWHFQHGPIDIVIGADGDARAVAEAHDAAWQRFETVLGELVAELPLLRSPVAESPCPLQGVVARRMWNACAPYRAQFITPMAAVAGSVAEELIGCYARVGMRRAWVNNGGDIALHLTVGEALAIGVYADVARFDPSVALATDGRFTVDAASRVRGVATSGWRGRSFSLGIADSVTVLAATASKADAAATVVANAVDVDDARIVRRRASELKDDSDLGERLVTADVPPLDRETVHHALAAGKRKAEQLRDAGLIESALLVCQGWATTLEDRVPQRLAAAGKADEKADAGSVFA